MLQDGSLSNQEYISGSMKWKYHQRAMIPLIKSKKEHSNQTTKQNTQTESKTTHSTEMANDGKDGGARKMKDVEVQTVLRDSETQTLPYTPKEYVLPGTSPEVLKIKHFKYGKQLPPTLGNHCGIFN